MTMRVALEAQADACARLGSPFMGMLLTELAQNWPTDSALGQKFATFEGDVGPAGHSLPLRIAAGLHALVLNGAAPDLAAHYPPNRTTNTELRIAVLEAMAQHAAFLLDWTNSPPQTNEVRRSAALIAGALVAADRFKLPIHLSELGASGGLNLLWDKFALQVAGRQYGHASAAVTLSPDWAGPSPPDAEIEVADRRGVDLNPLNPVDQADLLRLTAYLWADQPDRLVMTRAAASIAQDGMLDRGDAIDWLEKRLANAPAGALHLIQHTVAWQYFPKDRQIKGRALIEAAGTRATAARPLAWLSMESDGDATGKAGAALTLRLWPGDATLNLGRADFHGRWINWTHSAE